MMQPVALHMSALAKPGYHLGAQEGLEGGYARVERQRVAQRVQAREAAANQAPHLRARASQGVGMHAYIPL